MKTSKLKIKKWLFSLPTKSGYFKWIESSSHVLDCKKYKLHHNGLDSIIYLN